MTHYDDLETRSADERAADLPAMLGRAIANAKLTPGFARALREVEPQDVATLADLARLPVLRKSELSEAQGKRRPFGGYTTRRPTEFDHIFQSPGPIYEPGRWMATGGGWAGSCTPQAWGTATSSRTASAIT